MLARPRSALSPSLSLSLSLLSLYYVLLCVVLLLSRACLELLVDELPLLVEDDGHMKGLFNFLRDDQVTFLVVLGIPTGCLATVYRQDYLRLNYFKLKPICNLDT